MEKSSVLVLVLSLKLLLALSILESYGVKYVEEALISWHEHNNLYQI